MRNCKKSICIALSVSLILCLMPWKQLDANISDAEEHSVSNPRVEDSISTWDCIYFGYYYQSNDIVKEPIKWRVLSVDGDDAFLLADKNLAYQYYYSKWNEEISWEICSLRTWLNEDFYNEAFPTDFQKNSVKISNVVNKDNPEYGTTGGNDTQDRIYIPSVDEMTNPTYGFVEEYAENSTRLSSTTEYALNTSPSDTMFEIEDDYWLRSPGDESIYVCIVNGVSGELYIKGTHPNPNGFNVYVRPCLHLDLSSSEWSYAGTVSSNGEENALPSPTPFPTATPTPTPTVKPTPTVTPTVTPTQTPSNTQTPDVDNKTTPQPTNHKSISPTSTTVTAPSKPTKLSAKNNKKKTVTLTWKKVKGAKGYQVQYAVNTVFSKRKTKTTTKTKLVVKSLKKRKTYSFRVRAYKLDGKKKIYGKWSTVKRVKIKK